MTQYPRFALVLLTALAAAILGATPAAAQREVTDAPETWVHRHVAVGFATRIGNFHRQDITEYNDDGSDASVGYDLVRDGRKVATVTIYVFPPYMSGSCEDQYAEVKRGIEQSTAYRDVRLTSESRTASPGGRKPRGAFLASYTLKASFAGEDGLLNSDAYVFCPAGGRWLVTYRATSPAGEDVKAEVETFFHSFRWPEMLDN